MYKRFYYLVFLLFGYFPLQAQNAIAKIKYEQAEEAFAKNDFAQTLQMLSEAEKLLGTTNPKILYLRILAEKGRIEKGGFDFALLEASRNDVQFYLKNYENVEGIEEKFKNVYLFSESLQRYPATKEEWDKKEADRLAAINRTREERNKRLKRADEFVDSLCQKWKWKTGQTKAEFKDYTNKIWLWVPFPEDSVTLYKPNFLGSVGELYTVTTKNRLAIAYSLCVFKGSKSTVQQTLDELKATILAQFPERAPSFVNPEVIGVRGYSGNDPTEIFLYKKDMGKKESIIILGFREWKK